MFNGFFIGFNVGLVNGIDEGFNVGFNGLVDGFVNGSSLALMKASSMTLLIDSLKALMMALI